MTRSYAFTFNEAAKLPVTDEERSNMTQIATGVIADPDKGAYLSERDVFVLMTVIKEQQDTLFEISKSV